MKPNHLVILLYDSITNSVFEGQVLKPYYARIQQGHFSTMTIISYEKQGFTETSSSKRIREYLASLAPTVTYTILTKPLFLRLSSLDSAIHNAAHVLASQPPHHLIARGPFSAYIARHAVSKTTHHVTLQVRGIAHEEYKMTHAQSAYTLKPLHMYRSHLFKRLERHAYAPVPSVASQIETVTPALSNYIRKYYKITQPITIAQHDVPQPLSFTDRTQARTTYRKQLEIPQDAPVFAYNGSLHAWQYPEAVFTYFKQKLTQNPASILLFISHDAVHARHASEQIYKLPTCSTRFLSVAHHEVIPLLCAADYGLLFRQNHIVNWTSRPTKLLEYQCAGLTIIHNNTIDILQNDPNAFYADPMISIQETL